jgi:hypothetical protein
MACLDLPGALDRCLDNGRLTVADLYAEAQRLAALLDPGDRGPRRPDPHEQRRAAALVDDR